MTDADLRERLIEAGHHIKWARDAMLDRIARKRTEMTDTERETNARYNRALEGLREAVRRLNERQAA